MDDTQAYIHMDCKRGNPVSALGVAGNSPWKNRWFLAHTLKWPSGLVCLATCKKKYTCKKSSSKVSSCWKNPSSLNFSCIHVHNPLKYYKIIIPVVPKTESSVCTLPSSWSSASLCAWCSAASRRRSCSRSSPTWTVSSSSAWTSSWCVSVASGNWRRTWRPSSSSCIAHQQCWSSSPDTRETKQPPSPHSSGWEGRFVKCSVKREKGCMVVS